MLQDRVSYLEESVAYFSSANKASRERWVATNFLQALRFCFSVEAVQSPLTEPPDIVFRTANFEVKEILDQGRKRHRDLKSALERARRATSLSDLLELYTPVQMDPIQIGERVRLALEGVSTHYAPAVRRGLDLLFYVNLRDCFFAPGKMPLASQFASYGWRSVFAFENSVGLIFFASEAAPTFIRRFVGSYSSRRRTGISSMSSSAFQRTAAPPLN